MSRSTRWAMPSRRANTWATPIQSSSAAKSTMRVSTRAATRPIRSRARSNRSGRSTRTDRVPHERRVRQDVIALVNGEHGAVLVGSSRRTVHARERDTYADRNRTSYGQSLGVVDSARSYQDWTFNTGLAWQATRVVTVNVAGGPWLPRAEPERPRGARPQRSRLRGAGGVDNRERRA